MRGPEGNARLTALTGTVLLVLLAAEGATLISLQTFVSWHIFLGMLLIPIVGLKIASTGYRFAQYYLGNGEYVRAGPPHPALRILGPVVVASTVALFASGVALAALGRSSSFVFLLHKASFVVWVAAMSVHVLAHLPRIPSHAAPDLRNVGHATDSRARLSLIAATIVGGAILALATLPLTNGWAHSGERRDGARLEHATRLPNCDRGKQRLEGRACAPPAAQSD